MRKKLLNNPPQRLMISRLDNIGDVILTLPLAALLKQQFPQLQISFLGREYVRDIVEAHHAIDTFVSWEQLIQQGWKNARNLLKSYQLNCIIHAFARADIAKLAFHARIPWRIGTGRRWYHWFYCNQRVNFSRHNSALHEGQLNCELLTPFVIARPKLLTDFVPLITLNPQPSESTLKKIHSIIDRRRFNLILHPLSNGHAKEWPIEYYRQLIEELPSDQFNIMITGSSAEGELLKEDLIQSCPQVRSLCGELTLGELMVLIQHSDALIAASTGPLHIAAALGIKTLGLFPASAGIGPQRWQPLGQQAQYLIGQEKCSLCSTNNERSCVCMRAIRIEQVKEILLSWTIQSSDPV